ncbi:MAG: hypothetical protein ACLQU5_24770 [Isosphaeraceae bacterium]
MSAQNHDTTTPTEADALLARESLRRLSDIPGAGKSELRIHIQGDEQPGEHVTQRRSRIPSTLQVSHGRIIT